MPKRANQDGNTLVEVVIAVLLIAVMTGPMLSVALSGRMNMGRSDRRLAAAAAVRGLAEALKAYVVADPTLAAGPGVGVNGWGLPGDNMNGTLAALDAGHHALSPAQWLASLQAFNGRISYDVAIRSTPSGPQPDVAFSVAWDEP